MNSTKLFVINLLIANEESIIVGAFPTFQAALDACKACRVEELETLDAPKQSGCIGGLVVASGTIQAAMATGDAGFANATGMMSDEETEACETSASGKFEPHLIGGYHNTRGEDCDNLGVEIVETVMGMFGFNYDND